MMKVFPAIIKELLTLVRDRAGLLVLFLMPAILVVVITLVQENILELTGQKNFKVLFLDSDQGGLGKLLREQLASGNLELVVQDAKQARVGDIEAAVANGEYQAGIVIPPGASRRFQKAAARLLQPDQGAARPQDSLVTSLYLFMDPAMMAGSRAAITGRLQNALAAIALEVKLSMLSKTMQAALDRLGVPPGSTPLANEKLAVLFRQPLLAVTENQVGGQSGGVPQYNPVQQNVPAWALFGMFFTAIPIAGSIIRERTSGVWTRLMTLPVSPLALFAGKAFAYIGVCFCQFLLIALIGIFLFPLLGLPAFIIATKLPAVLLALLLSSLAACGYGIFLGLACNSYEQASTLGATTVVAAAAIGGVMVPVYAMPHTMQRLSIISPINWGLDAIHALLLRGAALPAVYGDFGRLFLFFAVCAFLAWKLALTRQ